MELVQGAVHPRITTYSEHLEDEKLIDGDLGESQAVFNKTSPRGEGTVVRVTDAGNTKEMPPLTIVSSALALR